MINYRKAETDDDIRRITNLADVIWHEHFTPIIGAEQVEYMLKKFQSFEAVKNAIKNDGCIYYMAEDGGVLAGYLGAQPKEDNVFLSKIYVERSHRRRGIAASMTELVKQEFPDKDYLWLTVNRNNDTAVAVYNALGFSLWREQVTDIGEGFVMDDYVFRLNLK